MHHETELAVVVRSAMREKNLSSEQVARMLNRSPSVIDKLLCGKIVPSKHLEKQLIDVLEVSSERIKKIAERRERKSVVPKTPIVATVSAKKA